MALDSMKEIFDQMERENIPFWDPYHVLRHPRLRQIVYARLLSTPDRSTSELLRTL